MNSDEPPAKLSKQESPEIYPFHEFTSINILKEQKDRKSLFLHGKIGKNENKDAVVILEKKPFDTSSEALSALFSSQTKLDQNIANDIYSSYDALPGALNSSIKATVIYPATSKHIEKYRKQNVTVLHETEEDYKNITKPYLEKGNMFSVKWVSNILDKTTESERIVFEDPDPDIGFILLPDMKWDVNDTESLYLIALTQRRDIKSLRDLREAHLPLLHNILKSGQKAIAEKYNVPKSSLRIFVHYQPSYYHFHVHFTHICFDAPGTTVTRAHLLSDIIDNIQMKGDYYQKKTLTFVGQENNGLTVALREKLEIQSFS